MGLTMDRSRLDMLTQSIGGLGSAIATKQGETKKQQQEKEQFDIISKALGNKIDSNILGELRNLDNPVSKLSDFLKIQKSLDKNSELSAYQKQYLDIQNRNLALKEKQAAGLDTSGLTNSQVLEGSQLAAEIGGKRYAEKLKPTIFSMYKEGKTTDDIRDALKTAQQSEESQGLIRNIGEYLSAGKSENYTREMLDKLDRLWQSGDQEGTKDLIKGVARKGAGVEENKRINGVERTVEFIDEIKSDLQNLEDNGINTNIFSGTEEDIRRKVGTVKEPELRKTANKIALAIIRYRKSMTGAQFSIPESKEYKQVFPSIRNTKDLNTALLDSLSSSFKGDLENFYALQIGPKNYRKLFSNNNVEVSALEVPSELSTLSDDELDAQIAAMQGGLNG